MKFTAVNTHWEAREGSSVVKVYAITNKVRGNPYTQYTLIYHDGVVRRRKAYSTLEKAREEAENAALRLSRQEGAVLSLSVADQATYTQAMDKLKGSNIGLLDAVEIFVRCSKRLPEGVTLPEVTDFFLSRHPKGMEKRLLADVAKEFLAHKGTLKKSEKYMKDLKGRLDRFCTDFPNALITDITFKMLQAYMDGFEGATRSKANIFRIIIGLFIWAAKRKYVSRDAVAELRDVELPELEEGEIAIFTPEEMALLFRAVRPELIPWLAIGAFAGLRAAELERLEWEDVDFVQGHITVTAAKAKTASRRIVPLSENLKAWLMSCPNRKGAVMPFANAAKQIDWLEEDCAAQIDLEQKAARERGEPAPKVTQLKWKRNALRHSYISYRVALTGDVARTSLEAGNSPNMIFKHYRALVSEAQAKAWFSITPKQPANVLGMAVARAS